MTKLVWDAVGERPFQTGIDRGVFYPGSNPGVAWNGIVSIEEKISGGEIESLYFDGIKYADVYSGENFQATLTAFTYPEEFEPYDGVLEVVSGFTVMGQGRKPFSLCYRTLLGNDTDSVDYGYKLHLVYNITASPTERPNTTLTLESVSLINFHWDLNAVPVNSLVYKPSAHFIINSTKVDPVTLAYLESVLYGSDTSIAMLPTPEIVASIISNTAPISDTIEGTISDLI